MSAPHTAPDRRRRDLRDAPMDVLLRAGDLHDHLASGVWAPQTEVAYHAHRRPRPERTVP
ncbi:hypothetical protein GCM10020000_01510 [Streptomyces olivoverticillatus]